MKRLRILVVPIVALFVLSGCGSSTSGGSTTDSLNATTDSSSLKTDSATGSTAGFKLGVQMWTFRLFSFADALNKVDSSGIKNIEAFLGQKLGGGMAGSFGIDMTKAAKDTLKSLLAKKGIRLVAFGVIVPKDRAEWIRDFELAKEFGLSYITAEPIKSQWNMIDSLAGVYGIPVAIHEHAKPNVYWSPDSVLAAIQGHAHIGACADVGHWPRSGLNPVECLTQLNGHIIGVHLKDIVVFNKTDAADTAVGKGINNFPAILAELKKQNFNGMLSIEQESNWLHSLPDIIHTKNYYDSIVTALH